MSNGVTGNEGSMVQWGIRMVKKPSKGMLVLRSAEAERIFLMVGRNRFQTFTRLDNILNNFQSA